MKSIGNTALLQLGSFWAKAEYENRTGSVKDRAAKAILEDAVQQGILRPGGTVIEATSGNMGISLAAISREMGCRCILVMPDSMSRERQQRMLSSGAEILLTPGETGMAGAMRRANALAASMPNAYLPKQFENTANAAAHYRTTGPEIWRQMEGKVDIFVAGVGTGGTITGVGRYLKEQDPNIRIVAVEPAESAVLSGGKGGSHGIQGIGAGFVPAVMETSLLDGILPVGDGDAFYTAKKLGAAGISVGISSGAAAWAAAQIAAQNPGKRIVTLFPDSADRYRSLGL